MTATSSTTWSRRSCSVSPNRSGASCCRPPSSSRLSGPLCDAVTGQDGGKATLEALERGEPVPGPARRPPPVVPLPPSLRRRAAGAPARRAARRRPRPAPAGERVVRAERRPVRGDPPRAGRRGLRASGGPDRAGDPGDCARTGRRPRCVAGSRRFPTRWSRSGPVLSVGYVGALLVRRRGRGRRGAPAGRRAVAGRDDGPTGNPSAEMVVVDEEEFRACPAAIAVTGPDWPAPRRCGRHHDPCPAGARLVGEDDHSGAERPRRCSGSRTGPAAISRTRTAGMRRAWRAWSGPGTSPTCSACAITLADIRIAQGRLREAMQHLRARHCSSRPSTARPVAAGSGGHACGHEPDPLRTQRSGGRDGSIC